MHHARKKTAPRTMTTFSKRLKSGPDVRSNEVKTVRWSDINYNLISDIFSHLFTIQQLKYRRVSSAWNTLLLDHLDKSAVVCLRFPELKYWKAIVRPPARETCLGMRPKNVNLVTDRTRRLIIDFANKNFDSEYFVRDAFGREIEPLADLRRYHPQIFQVVLYRILKPYTSPFGYNLEELGYDPMPSVRPTFVVTLCEFVVRTEKSHCYLFSKAKWRAMKSWKMSWPKTTLKYAGNATADFDALSRERSLDYWPYPADQLTWLSSCLDLLPEEDLLFYFLSQQKDYTYLVYSPPTGLTLRGITQSRYILAFTARYMVTFRRRLNLPPPPHPLIWNN